MATPDEDNRLGRAYAAPEVTVFYDRGRCRHYAECVRGLPQVFDPTRRPWIRADLADADTVAEVVRRCPTAPSTTACWRRNPRHRPVRPSSPGTPGGRCWSAAILSWTPPWGRCPRPGPRCAPAAAPRTSLSVTARAASTPAPLAAPGTRWRHPRSVEPETGAGASTWTARTAWAARAAAEAAGSDPRVVGAAMARRAGRPTAG
jgi:uncharacterized Fe-S cluster protein YjdI